MNKVGIYYAFWTRDWNADFLPFVKKVKRLGFDVLEVNSGAVAQLSPHDRMRLREEAVHHDVELTGCIGLSPRYDVASADAATRKRGIAFLARQIRAAAATGIAQMGGILYGSWPATLPLGHTDRRPYLERSVRSMREVVKVAEDARVTLNMEVVNRFEQFLINTAEEAVQFVKAVGSPNCRILLDTFHMNIEEDSFRLAIRKAGRFLGHLHLGETNRRPPGRGKIPWDEVFGAVAEVEYKGAIVMEPFLVPGGEVGRDIRVYRDLRGKTGLDQEAARACAFVKSRLKRIET